MSDAQALSISKLRLRHERHVVHARQRARDIAALLGFESQEQIRLATAASELARNAFRYANNGAVEFLLLNSTPQVFVMAVTDSGPGIPDLAAVLDGRYVSKTGLGKGLTGTKRLLEHFQIASSPEGTRVEAGKALPPTALPLDAERVRRIVSDLAKKSAADPFDEVERQNQELVQTLSELREKQELLTALNRELGDTNRGVVALYSELDQNAIDLRKVSDLKTSFLSNLTHEFRTPLNSIASLCQMLVNRSDGDLTPEQEKQVNYIQRSSADLSELVNDLLDIAKVEAGKIDVKPGHFEAKNLFGVLRGMLTPLLAGNSVELLFDADPGLPSLYTDEAKVSQILRNLISNALKFTPRGHVRLSAHAEPGELIVFQVADTGIGIASHDQERVFEEFIQLESEIQTRVKGTGLGLPLARRLAGLLGGTISLASEPGHGSTFTVRLPIRFSPPKQGQPHPSSNQSATGGTILFIEDNPETNFVHQASMKNTNYRLVFAANLPEARAIIRASAPAAVALDRYLDEKDCLFYIKEIKAQGYSGPIVVISVVDDVQSAADAGADAFLLKPVTPFALVNTFRELIEGRASKSVLLVDDDEVTRYLLGEALAKLGYRVLEAPNGRQGIQMAESHIPSVMFLDIMMPDLSGFEVLRELRGNPATSAIPVIVHTSKDLSVEDRRYLDDMKAAFYPKQPMGSAGTSEQLLQILSAAGVE